MKFKKMKKRFFSLSRGNGGFTLVELIVVIAILAILGGVAVPAYSGYVEKAKLAGDEQLLAAVNTAFAAACAENGTDTYNLSSKPEIVWKNGKKAVESVTLYGEAFQRYFADNEDAEFEVFESLYFSRESHMFQADEVFTLTYGNGYVTILRSDAEKLGGSAFITAMENGVSDLLGLVDMVTRFGVGMLDEDPEGQFAQLIMGEDYLAFMADVLKTEDVNTAVAEMAADMVAKGLATSEEDAYKKIMTNNAVLYAAKNTTTSKNELLTILRSENPKEAIKGAMGTMDEAGNATGLGLAQASAAYGMYTAFIHSRPDNYTYTDASGTAKTKQDLINETSNPLNILNGLGNKDFQDYMDSPEAETDLDGYLAAMNMINNSTGDSNAVSNLLTNGFTDPDLINLINQSMKQS